MLPTLCNVNPRSVYNKIDEFHNFVKQESLDVIFISESWERENLPLKEIIKLKEHTVISNVSQRHGVGGRPALVVNNKKYQVQNITNTLVQIPWGIEAVWCVLTPKKYQTIARYKRLHAVHYIANQIQKQKLFFLITYQMYSTFYLQSMGGVFILSWQGIPMI